MTPRETNDWRVVLPLWAGLLAAPMAWFVHLMVGYVAGAYHCQPSTSSVVLAATLLCLAASAAGGWAAWIVYREARREEDRPFPHRSYFMAESGLAMSAFFGLTILLAAMTIFFLDPCGAT